MLTDLVHIEPHTQFFSRLTRDAQEAPRMSAEEEAFATFFEQLCRERDGDECSQVTLRFPYMLPLRISHMLKLSSDEGASHRVLL